MFETEATVRQSIAILSNDISQIQEQLLRLNEARAKLESQEAEMTAFQGQFLLPELNSNTWAGKYAAEFETIRTSKVYEQYNDLTSSSFSTYYRQIEMAQNFLSVQLESKTQQLQNRRNQLEQLQKQEA
ncbi:hypothetical protein BpOF4_12795 [Alkalihalophilus pseudofirmus OF4]|uniref:Uncharacterized protein n=1 Tax=Alkalihalophilus pseudofirmus (strain ATCC BAA-2126 / JCM 17055 / OF4) TaxID=398511 RepID=D3FWW2_ALKPO|nr:DUF5082 family protein [Alkalihalophilus pseudofirmus]ADC50610.1 hypothetical protein BpOF4_12795 [Alkalihalophilus pseudofirmus OF4]